MTFSKKLKDMINLIENWLSYPEDNTQLEEWIESANTLAYSFEFSDKEQSYVDKIIEMYEEQIKLQLQTQLQTPLQTSLQKLETPLQTNIPSINYLNELLDRKQTEQRTSEWYTQMSTIISASELGNLFASVRQRAKMVVSKTVPYESRNQSLATTSSRMSAFDWGIRFEPVVKQIYEYKYGVNIKELGRLYHQTDKRCAASPDGLIYNCPKNEKTGRLIEIKCPVTRVIDGKIPKDYYSQMQMQLHVTGLTLCEYVEAVFSSKYNNMVEKTGPALYNGFIAVIRYKEIKEQEFYYEYSPVNCDTWTPVTDDEVVEIIPWKLVQWSEQTVVRSEEWWTSIIPIIDRFWEDVEKAKRGEFVVPESTRAKKEEKCKIVFKKLDENGEVIPLHESVNCEQSVLI